MHKAVQARIEGLAPLLLHNGQLANPFNPIARKLQEVTGVRKKAEEHHEKIAEIEFHGALYLDDERYIVIPGENIERMLIDAAKKSRGGKDYQAGIICDGAFRLEYDGPKADKLYEDKRFVSQAMVTNPGSRGKVLRTRPRFDSWALTFVVHYAPMVIKSSSDIRQKLELAGSFIGLGDWRPKHGRFKMTEFKEVQP